MSRIVPILWLLGSLAAAQQPGALAVVELFTSEGCSSCPAADELLARLDVPDTAGRARRPVRGVEVIILGEHVDYWDDLGWKDRFSSPLFSARQQDYGIALRRATVYTPQMVVNGHKEVNSTDFRDLRRAISEASSTPRAPVEMRVAENETIYLRVGKLPAGSHQADVLLAIAESGIETFVQSGENQGRRLRHAAVVRSMSKLGELSPEYPGQYTAEAKLNLNKDWNRKNVKIVLLVQDRVTRRILGAAAVKL
jgi:hypothetical protein